MKDVTSLKKKVKLTESTTLTPNIKALRFSSQNLISHIPGQYYTIRLTSQEGFVAERDYSVSNSKTEKDIVEFGVELIKNGEVSPFLHKLKAGDEIEIKGPLGNHFLIEEVKKRPTLLIAGGSGIVPFMSFIRSKPKNKVLLLGSFKTEKDIPYHKEIKQSSTPFTFTLTSHQKRINKTFLREILDKFESETPRIFICGGSVFVQDIRKYLITLNVPEKDIKIEMFG